MCSLVMLCVVMYRLVLALGGTSLAPLYTIIIAVVDCSVVVVLNVVLGAVIIEIEVVVVYLILKLVRSVISFRTTSPMLGAASCTHN